MSVTGVVHNQIIEQLTRMLANVIDANYGTDVHDIGNGDGLSPEEAAEIQTWWQEYLDSKVEKGKQR